MLQIGDSAPDFRLPDQDNHIHQLSDYSGRWVVLYFYPADNTPGCTREACGIRDNYEAIAALAAVLGVSKNSVASHKKFAETYQLPFTLLADTDQTIIEAYGANGVLLPKRITFIIDPQGKIARLYEKVSPDTHAARLLEDLRMLQSEA